MEQLRKVGKLRDARVLTESEFADKKAQILGSPLTAGSHAGWIDAAGIHCIIGTCPRLFTGCTTNRTHAIHAPLELRAHANSSPVAYPVSDSPPW